MGTAWKRVLPILALAALVAALAPALAFGDDEGDGADGGGVPIDWAAPHYRWCISVGSVPELTLKYDDGDLAVGVDYTYEIEKQDDSTYEWSPCSDSGSLGAMGTYRFKITGVGRFAGTMETGSFDVVESNNLRSADIAYRDLRLYEDAGYYTLGLFGESLDPDFIVQMDGRKLEKGTDYKVEYRKGGGILGKRRTSPFPRREITSRVSRASAPTRAKSPLTCMSKMASISRRGSSKGFPSS